MKDEVRRPDRLEVIVESFAVQQRAMWSSMWPFGHCAVSSLLLCPILCAGTGKSWWVAVRRFKDSRGRLRRHAWCVDAGDTVVDVTYGQFAPQEERVWFISDCDDRFKPYVVLDPDSEDRARRSIQPSDEEGWAPGSIIKQLFAEMEREDEKAMH